MKLTKKHIGIAGLTALCAVTTALGVSFLAGNTKDSVLAETTGVPSSVYFYDNLTDAEGNEYTLAKKFYGALDKLNTDGEFKDGVVDYSLTDNDLATSDMIKAWVEGGDLTIPKAFSAARDAYYMDHPELFYIDIYKVTISAACVGDNYTAYIDSGREANLYAADGFTSEAQVNSALTAYYAKIDEIAEYAQTEAEKEQYGTAKKVLQARYANQYIATHTEYDDISASDSAITTASPAQVAYGALVNGKAVCNGYSRAFKAVMDKLEIPCVVVGGYSVAKNSAGGTTDIGEAHAWNYVWFETPVEEDNGVATQADEGGAWYGYDVTWNSTGKSVNSYIDMGNFAMLKAHWPDGEISTSGYLVNYPVLSNYNYGCKTDSNGIVYSIDYVGNGESDDFGNEQVETWISVSYNGKGAVKLFEEDKLRIIYRRADMGKDGPNWEPWIDLYAEIKIGPFGKDNAFGNFEMYTDTDYETKIYGNPSILYTQFAVLNGSEEDGIKPDKPYYGGFDDILTVYKPETDLNEYVVTLSDIAVNDAYLTYVAAPHVVTSTPDHKNVNIIKQSWAIPGTNLMDDQYAFEMYVTYHEPLKVLDESKPIGVSFTSASFYSSGDNIYDYAGFTPLDEQGTMVEIIDQYTLHFRFKPSLMYEHNGMHYYFTFSNVGSAYVYYRADGSEYVSEKTPNVLIHNFCREYIACNKCLPNGRMLLDCVAQPMLLSNTDLSVVDFQDEEGNYFSAGQRSQMMLVVNKPTEKDQETMTELLENEIDLSEEQLSSAATYEIDLQICARYVYIPNGSYVKVALGFPEGFGPDDEGVTFKIYHYRRSADRKQIIGIEEIPCVVTRFGIVATIDGFSPFVVVAVDEDKATTKNIYASVDGNGGKLSKEDGQIQTLKEGDSYTYTIVPDAGYQIYKVTLNGKSVTDKIADGKLTLNYAELDISNELEIMYIANAAVKRFAEKEMDIVDPVKVIVATDGTANVVEGTGGKVDLPVVDDSGDDNPSTPGDDTPSTPGDDTPSTPGDGSNTEAGVNPPSGDSGKNDSDNKTVIILLAAFAGAIVLIGIVAVVIIKRSNNIEEE